MSPHLVHVFPAFAGGGPEVRTRDIIRETSHRFRHTVLSLSNETSGCKLLADGNGVACRATQNRSLRKLGSELVHCEPHLVLTYGWGGTDALLAARLAGLRRVVHMEDGFLDDEVDGQKLQRKLMRRVAFPFARQVIVPSKSLESIARKVWRVPQHKLRYLPNGVDLERFRPVDSGKQHELRRTLRLPIESILVGIVGGLRPEKNQSRLLNAIADIAQTHPDVHVLIVGDGPLRQTLEAETIQLKLQTRVHFTGAIERPEQHYQAMDICALTSDTEQMPLTILEAMATALPVVSTDVGDVRQMLPEVNQPFVTPLGEESSLSAALAQLVESRQQRLSLGEANRVRCSAVFDKQEMIQNYTSLYEEFLSGPRAVASSVGVSRV